MVLGAELADVDLSDHQPRDVSDVDIEPFDVVVALDRMVADDLAGAIHGTQLVSWSIPDPYGGSLDLYRSCAAQILARLPELVK